MTSARDVLSTLTNRYGPVASLTSESCKLLVFKPRVNRPKVHDVYSNDEIPNIRFDAENIP